MNVLYRYTGLPIYISAAHLLWFYSLQVACKRRTTRKKGRKMEFEMFHNPIGVLRRKADYKYGRKVNTTNDTRLL